MFDSASKFACYIGCLALSLGWAFSAPAATPTPAEALAFVPLQKNDVDYDRPDSKEVAACVVEAEAHGNVSGWVVRDAQGRMLRRYLDTNRDRKLDLWCYYKNGVEVYRDVDSNFNGKADQYRWLGTEGMRWGIDKDENLNIDSWKAISAEEVTAEVVAAVRDRDAARFQRLLMTESELESLGLGEQQTKELQQRISKAGARFAAFARDQKLVGAQSKWVYFSSSRPGVLPAGTDGATKDIILYDSVTAVIEASGKHGQIVVGSLIRVGDVWRAIDLPQSVSGGQANDAAGGLFFHVAARAPSETVAPSASGLSKEMQQLMTEYEKVERSITTTSAAAKLAQLNEQRAQILEKLIDASRTGEEHLNWSRQFADIVSAGVQSGEYATGLKKLESVYKRLAAQANRRMATAYVKYRFLNAEYGLSLQQEGADYGKIQEKWLTTLEQFVKDYPQSDDAADAMMQLALAQEFAGKVTDADAWYGRIVREFPTSPFSRKAAGAQTRIHSVGKAIPLRGKSVSGRSVDLAAYRGKVVLIHFWATYCDPCKEEFALLKQMKAKYGARGFDLIGISLDVERDRLVNYLQSHPLPWMQLYENGGLDSRYANELGILTMPMMILVDQSGRVVRRNMHASELETELRKLLR